MAKFTTNAEGNFFVQLIREAPFDWLTCTGVGDVDIPRGDRTPVYCPDPLNSGYFKIDGFVRGDAGAGTYSLTKPLAGVYNFLIEQNCAFNGRINWVCRGVREDPRNFEMAALLIESEMGRSGISNPVRGPEDTESRVNTNADVNFTSAVMIYHLAVARTNVNNLGDANAIYFLPERCEDRCGDARALCSEGLMGMGGVGYLYLYESEVKKTHDGNSWAETPTDPFTWGGTVNDVIMMETIGGIRYIVFRGAVAGAPPEASYSDNYGAAWTNVFMSAVNGVGINACELSGARLFACGDGGYIYRSANAGVSWEIVEDAEATTEDLNDLAFFEEYGYAVGDAGAFVRSLDSGETWNEIIPVGAPGAGVNYLSCAVNDKGHLFIGTNDGRLFRSSDRGITWVEWVDHGGGSIDAVKAETYRSGGYVMGYVYNNATPVGTVYRSDDGGATFWSVTPVGWLNAGLNDLFLCDPNYIAVVGNAYDGTTFVALTRPS